MPFKKFIDVERLDKEDCDGLLLGICYVFPKIDGTNASLWYENGVVRAGSRSRDLSEKDVKDNWDFRDGYLKENYFEWLKFFHAFPHFILYGEYLVPHSLKTYRETAWKQFYCFDVYDNDVKAFLKYEDYKPILEAFGISYIPVLRIIENPSIEQLEQLKNQNIYLIEEGKGVGEGIVIKRYNWTNKFGHRVYGKLVTNEFKENNMKVFGGNKIQQGEKKYELEIANQFVTQGRLSKIIDKMCADRNTVLENDNYRFDSKRISELLERTFHEIVTEEMWDIIKKYKLPQLDFKLLRQAIVQAVKQTKPELF